MTGLEELLERMERIKRPDRLLSSEIAQYCGAQINPRSPTYGRWEADEVHGYYLLPDYTSSLDAAVSLVEEMLPGWGWSVNAFRIRSEGFEAHVEAPNEYEVWMKGSTAPLALCAALLRALSDTKEA